MTAFRAATNTVGGIAFGLFLVFGVPGMAVITLGSGVGALVGTHTSINGETEKARSNAFAVTVVAYLIFIVACAGDYGLLRLILKLNRDNKK